ncbi:MAG: 1-acyl-sn-glycerol-3-phosphate acyltransferase [Phormidesmis sp.]
MTHAQPALDFIPPRYSPWFRRMMRPLMPAWTAWQTDIVEVEARNVETLAQLYEAFNLGKTRLLLAFRHPNSVDPYVLSHLLWRDLPQAAREQQLNIGTAHSHFLYDRGIPLWAGSYLGGVFSRLGGIPIQRGKLDLLALKTARRLFCDGELPLAAAPEGGNNGHNEIVSPLEPGIAQLAFWCAEDMADQGRDESVVVLPIGIQYRYVTPPWKQLAELMSQLETDCGIGYPSAEALQVLRRQFEKSQSVQSGVGAEHIDLYSRLYRLAEHLLTLMEGYYANFYRVSFEEPDGALGLNSQLAERLSALMDKSLRVAESYFGLRAKGSVIDRCRKLEQAGWDRIYREDTPILSAVELGLANRVAEEADLRMWHMRLMESFVAVTGRYVKECPSVDRFAETLLLLRDMVAKLKGDSPSRPQLGLQKAIVTVGQPIDAGVRLGDYKQKRRGAIAQLTADLQAEMVSLILTD